MPILGTGAEITGDAIVFFGIGFLLAALLALVLAPFVHRRAVRLTSRRLDTQNPVSMQEIKAEKDHLRAEFAMSTRRLETSIEELKTKTFTHVNALAQKSNVIKRLKDELDARAAKIHVLEQRESALEARERSLFEQLRTSKDEMLRLGDALHDAELTVADMRKIQHRLEDATEALRNAEKSVADMRTSQQQLEGTIDEHSWLADNQREEIVALRTEVATIRQQVYEMAAAVAEAESRSARERVELPDAAASDNISGATENDVSHAAFNRNPFADNGKPAQRAESKRHPITALQNEIATIRRQVYDTATEILESENRSTAEWIELHKAAAARSKGSDAFANDRRQYDAPANDDFDADFDRNPFADAESSSNGGAYKKDVDGIPLTGTSRRPVLLQTDRSP